MSGIIMCAMHDFKDTGGISYAYIIEQIKKDFGLFQCKNEMISIYHKYAYSL